jgi:hypothetical protein
MITNDVNDMETISSAVIEWGASNTSSVYSLDCNGNQIIDRCEIELGTVADENMNGIPDVCETASANTSNSTSSTKSDAANFPAKAPPKTMSELLHAGATRFAFHECMENRTWEQLASAYKSAPHMLSSGGLPSFSGGEDLFVWMCLQAHPCVDLVTPSGNSGGSSDAMCYLYDERLNKWYPYALRSEMMSC